MGALATEEGQVLDRAAATANNRHKLRNFLYVVAAFIIAAGAALAWLLYAHHKSIRSFRQAHEFFELEIDRNLAPGSDKHQVQRFLDEHHFSYVELNSRNFGPVHADQWYDDAFTTLQGYSSYIEAPRPICRIFAEFKFDRNNRFLNHRDHLSCKESLF
jgi:hypothetical protein